MHSYSRLASATPRLSRCHAPSLRGQQSSLAATTSEAKRNSSRCRRLSSASTSFKDTTSRYQPPRASYLPPATRMHGRVDDHPMPDDMPREDYSTPAMYTLSMLARILRYCLYGALGITAAGLIGVEGGHQYIENIRMAYPSHIDSREIDPNSDEAVYAWAEENDAWTGGSAGGTSSALGFYARHTLRSAWLAREYGVGSSGATVIGRSTHDAGGDTLKGMIGAGRNGVDDNNLNTSDPSSIMAESYLASTIQAARSKGIAFPGNLSGNREIYPPGSASIYNQQIPADRVALDLLERHAEVLERIGKSTTLQQAEDTYEILLRSILDRGVDNAIEETVKRAELIQLAKKLGDVNIRLGDLERATGWWEWGLRYGGLAPQRAATDLPPVAAPGVRAAETSGWFSRWLGSSPGSPPADVPGSSAEHSIAQNSHAVAFQSTAVPESPLDLPPLVRRAAISLISSYASNLGMRGKLAEASAFQQLGLHLTKAVDPSKESSPAASLQNLWLNHRSSLLTMNAAEVAHAQGEDISIGLVRLAGATKQAEEVIRNIATVYTTLPKADPAVESIQYTPSRAIPLRNMEIGDRFGKNLRKSPLARPASQLLRDAERTAAEGWNLTGLLYEKLARTSEHHAAQRQALHEMALDCHERAMGWSTIAGGGEADGVNQIAIDEDALGLGGRGIGKTTEYWRNYMRVRAKLEAQVPAT